MDKRRHPRSKSMKGTRVRWRSDGEYFLSLISDLSLGGVFIHTPKPPPVGTALSLLLDVPSSAIQASAVVRRSALGQGMGVEFESMASDDQARLASLLQATDAPKAQKKARNIDYEHRESVVAAPPIATTLQERVLEDPNSNRSLRTEIQPGREQDGPGLGGVESNPSEGGSGTLGDAGTDLRRSRRVCLDIPVGIYVCQENEKPIFEEGKTLTVNAHGALLALTTPVQLGQTLHLINLRTQKEIECRVRRLAMRYPTGLLHIGVEFLAMSPSFWDIASPPADWDPGWAAERKLPQRPLPSNAAPPLNPLLGSPASGPELEIQLTGLVKDATKPHPPASAADSATLTYAKPNSRRSTRLAFKIPVVVHAQEENEDAFSAEGKTVFVNVDGALLALPTEPNTGQSLLLFNCKTGKEIVCYVRFVQLHETGMYHVGVEFITASPKFWGVNFPPEDWDAAERKLPQRPLPSNTASLKPLHRSTAGEPSNDMQSVIAAAVWAHDSLEARESKIQPKSPLPKKAAPLKPSQQEQQDSLKASEVKTKPKGWHVLSWPVIALAASIALFIIWATVPRSNEGGSATLQNSTPAGVAAEDANIIPRLEGSRLAKAEDFDPDAVSWLRSSGLQVSGGIAGAYSGHDKSSAYILITKENARRVAILADGRTRYDAEYPVIAIAARIPKELIQKISWADPSPPESDGDGYLSTWG